MTRTVLRITLLVRVRMLLLPRMMLGVRVALRDARFTRTAPRIDLVVGLCARTVRLLERMVETRGLDDARALELEP